MNRRNNPGSTPDNSPESTSDLQKLRSIFRPGAATSIARWCRPMRSSFVLLCVLNVIYSLMTLGIPLLTRGLVDSAVSRSIGQLWRYGLFLALLLLAARCTIFLCSWYTTTASAKLQRILQDMLMRELLASEYAALKPFHSGELVNRAFSDVTVVRDGVIRLIPDLLRILVSFLGASAILITMDWRFLPLMLLCAIVWSCVTLLFRKNMKERHKRMHEAEDVLHASTQETLENIRVIKASASETRLLTRIGKNAEHLREEQIRSGRLTLTLRNGMGSMFDFSWLIAYLWGSIKIFRGEFTYGSLAALIPLVGRIQGPVANATSLLAQIYGVIASAERLQEIADLPKERNPGSLHDFDRILLENVSFQYYDGISEVLTQVCGEIRKGDCIALTGLSGGGKTSFFQLLLGIYQPTGGSVMFEKGSTMIPASKGTRRLFAYVPQGNTLFSGTLRDNLTQFTDMASPDDIAEAVRAACLEDLADEIGLNAVLGERGIGLSEGQAQRVAVARALLSRAPILLLDEATSALDEATEAGLLENIAGLRHHDRFGVETIIIVTHRPAALRICNRHWHIEDGRLSESG